MGFQIVWSLTDEEWDQVRTSVEREWEDSEFANYAACTLMFGTVQFTSERNTLFPPALISELLEVHNQLRREYGMALYPDTDPADIHGVTMSISDLATQLAHIVDIERFHLAEPGATAAFEETDGDINIRFTRIDDSVMIRSDLFDEPQILVTTEDFVSGVRSFAQEVAKSISSNIPRLLSLESFFPLTRYAP